MRALDRQSGILVQRELNLSQESIARGHVWLTFQVHMVRILACNTENIAGVCRRIAQELIDRSIRSCVGLPFTSHDGLLGWGEAGQGINSMPGKYIISQS